MDIKNLLDSVFMDTIKVSFVFPTYPKNVIPEFRHLPEGLVISKFRDDILGVKNYTCNHIT